MILEINNLSKTYGNKKILDNINLKLKEGEIISVIGASGSGKSTLLNILTGITNKDSGKININGEISYMLQSDALIESYKNIDNALIGLKVKKKLTNKKINEAKKYFIKYNLEDYIYKYPKDLSGGMRQRVALIRTLMLNPKIVLLDEPLSKIDYNTKLNIENDIVNELKKNKKSGIIVTHDIEEAVSMSHKIYLLRNGKFIKSYTINKDWDTPSNARLKENFRIYVNKILRNMKYED